MKMISYLLIVLSLLGFLGCEKNEEVLAPEVIDLSVKFAWEGMVMCDKGNPETHLANIPEKTKFIKYHMYDHAYDYDHGTVTFPYTGNNTIAKGEHSKIQGPCPTGAPGLYKITIKALDENKIVIGIGSTERSYP